MKEKSNNFFDDFHIGAYYLQRNARTEQHVKDLSDCGIDLVFGMDNDHPAIIGIDAGDESSALDFPYYGSWACDMNCYVHLEEKGVLTKSFKTPFRKRDEWSFDMEDFK